jgi:hypothetical protein
MSISACSREWFLSTANGVADIGTDIDAVDVEHFHVMEARLQQGRQIVGSQLVTGFDIDFAGLGIDHVQRRETADQLVLS